jgi:hypothetical protein
MNTNPRPSIWMLLAGGVVLFISSFLDWFGSGSYGINAWETEYFGLIGILVALMGLATALGVGLATFAGTKLPPAVLGFTLDQIYLIFGFTSTVITLGFLFAGQVKFGLILALLASVAILVGGFLENQATAKPAGPPTAF